jgi:hypothetical protein
MVQGVDERNLCVAGPTRASGLGARLNRAGRDYIFTSGAICQPLVDWVAARMNSNASLTGLGARSSSNM